MLAERARAPHDARKCGRLAARILDERTGSRRKLAVGEQKQPARREVNKRSRRPRGGRVARQPSSKLSKAISPFLVQFH